MSVYPEEFRSELESTLVGHRIVAASGNTVTLDNGQKYRLEGSSDCCAWADISVLAETLANSEHVITSVTQEFDSDEATWFIMADTHNVLQIDGEWNESNGYYFYGFSIEATSEDG